MLLCVLYFLGLLGVIDTNASFRKRRSGLQKIKGGNLLDVGLDKRVTDENDDQDEEDRE